MRHLESKEQIKFFTALEKITFQGRTLREYFYAVPNAGMFGGKSGLRAGARRKAEGVTAGVPDIESPLARQGFTGLHIEMKRKDGVPSDVSDAQEKMIALLRAEGRRCEVAFGCNEALDIAIDYVGIKH